MISSQLSNKYWNPNLLLFQLKFRLLWYFHFYNLQTDWMSVNYQPTCIMLIWKLQIFFWKKCSIEYLLLAPTKARRFFQLREIFDSLSGDSDNFFEDVFLMQKISLSKQFIQHMIKSTLYLGKKCMEEWHYWHCMPHSIVCNF